MSLRTRYQRYRQHGLSPLPTDASKEQRDARIAELRTLRRKRQRKVATHGGIGTLLVVVAVAALAYWLLMTIGGRDLLLQQIVARLPAGTELTWKQAEGPAAGPMTLHGVHFSMPRQRDPDCVPTPQASCAMGRIVFDAEQVTLDPALRPLLGRTLRLDALDVRGAVLDLPRSDTPFELPTWPDVLPQIEPPLALQADSIRIDGLRVVQEGESVIDVRSARGGLHAASGRLHVERLRVDSNRGQFAVHGDYEPLGFPHRPGRHRRAAGTRRAHRAEARAGGEGRSLADGRGRGRAFARADASDPDFARRSFDKLRRDQGRAALARARAQRRARPRPAHRQ